MKTLIFDFDGTIADSLEAFLEVTELILNRPQKLTIEEIKQLRGMPVLQIIKYLKIKNWQIPRMIIAGRRLLKVRMSKVKPFNGLPEVISQLHKAGYEMLILSTNSSATIADFLKTNQLDDYFGQIYGDIGLRGKAGGLKKVIKQHRLNNADCSYIGDEVRDVEAAKKVGIKVISVGWGFNLPEALKTAGPSALARQPNDLLKILISNNI